MNHEQEINSMSLIHFLTNQEECYIKIRNIATGKYMFIDTAQQTHNTIERKLVGMNNGTIIIMKPTHLLSKCNLIVLSNVNTDEQTKYYLTSTHDSAIIQKTVKKCDDSFFYLDGTPDEIYICANQNDKNMYGEDGRYLYMTDENLIYVNGCRNINSSSWKIEKINGYRIFDDVRIDYKGIHEMLERESGRNMGAIFLNTVKYFTILSTKNKMYLNVSLNKCGTFKCDLFGCNEKMCFMMRPVQNENCVYISHYIGGKYINLYTIPNSSEVYAGAPDCHWAKFYIKKCGDDYLFQCFHRESDKYGNYGRCLCMKKSDDGKYKICGDGSCSEETSKWRLEYTNN